MSKPLLVYQAPVFTRSGYGDHSRDILKSLFKMDKYDVKVVPTRWGNTPQNQVPVCMREMQRLHFCCNFPIRVLSTCSYHIVYENITKIFNVGKLREELEGSRLGGFVRS